MTDHLEQLEKERRKVDFDTFDISVKELASMAEQEIINIAPAYQRQFRWPVSNQSKLIESVFLGIPIPSLFMAANKDGTWELIDGVQRLSTLIHFSGTDEQLEKFGFPKGLQLEGLEVLSEFNGLRFNDLPQTLRLKFSLRPLKVTTLSDKSDLKVRFDLFERLNTGGIKLTDQEIRTCVFRGPFNDFLSELSENEDFRAVVNLPTSKENDGTYGELVLRFFAYLHNRENFDHSVVGFLNDYMSESSKHFIYKKNRKLFEKTFSELSLLLPEGIRRGNRKLTPVNLYEAISVGAAIAIDEGIDISQSNPNEFMNDADLTALTSEASNSRARVLKRINYCYKRFSGNV
ncbi:DUF262 domain-containing protein [Pseudomonas inefficax]|uniref:DUF262 domain-containing protein n=1 Tax=Pseudomonas inefficax TaxID=2078786 RepID=UPI002DB7EEF0|nr:DUF262 domain-containing protein [Pseudomonas sp. CMAA1741]MEC4559762.1 DUF262 domain-containing protein [Pseudomonas sp. CMAA1741]